MAKRVIAHIFTLLTLALSIVGCAPKEQNVCHVNPRNWDRSAEITIENNDTNTSFDISFFVRCNIDFNQKMLPVVVRTIAPDSSVHSEQAVWVFDSERAATPTATIQKIGYRNTCRLDQQGKYTFSVTPQTSVRGIEAVGLIIEKQE